MKKIIKIYFENIYVSHPGLKKIVSNLGWLVFDNFFKLGIGFLVGLWVARYLGPKIFGQMNYAIALVGLVSGTARLGLDEIVKRELIKAPDKKDEILGTALFLKVLGAFVLYFLVLIFSYTFIKNPIDTLLILIFALGIIADIFLIYDLWFQSQMFSKYTVIAQNSAICISSSLKIWFILTQKSVLYFAIASSVGFFVAGFLSFWIYHKKFGHFKGWKVSHIRAKELISESWPIIISGWTVAIYMKIDQVMLGGLADLKHLGAYAAAVRVTNLFYFIPGILAVSLFPSIVYSKIRGNHFYKKRLQMYFNLNVFLAYLVIFPLFLFAPKLINLFYGEEFLGAIPILQVYIWISLFVFLGVARSQFITNEGFFRFGLMATLLGAIINIILNYMFIPKYFGFGAAIATLISQAVSAFLSSFLFRGTIDVGKMQLFAIISPLIYSLNVFKAKGQT